MALIKNPVTIVQGVEDSAEYEEQANDYGTTAIIYGYTTEENSYGQTAITKKRGMPEDYPGPYTVTENGIVPCNSKRMTSDLTVNVEPELQSKEVVPSDSTDMLVGPDNGYYGLSMVTVKKINAYELTLLNSYLKQVVNAKSRKLFSVTNGYYKYVWLYPIAIDAADIKKGAEILGVTGTYAAGANLIELNVSESGTYIPAGDIDGYSKVIVTIPDPVIPSLQNKTFEENGVYTCDAGYDGLGMVTVNVPQKILQVKSITENGTHNPDSGFDGFSQVFVNVPNVEATLQEKTATANGTVTPDIGYDGLSKVIVAVPEKTLKTKSITANGTYKASSDGVDGFSQVTVNVPNGEANLQERTITVNGTYMPATGYDGFSKVVVNVANGGPHIEYAGVEMSVEDVGADGLTDNVINNAAAGFTTLVTFSDYIYTGEFYPIGDITASDWGGPQSGFAAITSTQTIHVAIPFVGSVRKYAALAVFYVNDKQYEIMEGYTWEEAMKALMKQGLTVEIDDEGNVIVDGQYIELEDGTQTRGEDVIIHSGVYLYR